MSKNITRNCVLIGICALMLFATGTPLSYGAEKVVLKLAHSDSTDVFVSRKHAQCLIFKELVESGSQGRIEVQVFGAGQVGGDREIVESCTVNTLQATVASGVIGSFFPPYMTTDIPYLFPSSPIAWSVLDGPFGKKLAAGLIQKTGLRNLAYAEVGFRNFTNSKKTIRTPADMKGLKFRIQETPLYSIMIKALGGIPTPISWAETYAALQSGVVDGHENPVSSIFFAKIYEVNKFVTLDGHVYGVDWFLINEKFYQSLSDELKYVILDAAKTSSGVGRGVQNLVSSITGMAKLKEAGVQIYAPTEKERELFKQATQKPVIDWLKTKVDEKLINEALKAVDEAVKKQKAEAK